MAKAPGLSAAQADLERFFATQTHLISAGLESGPPPLSPQDAVTEEAEPQ